MLLNYIRSNRPSYILWLVFVGCVLWLQSFLKIENIELANREEMMPLLYWVNYLLADFPYAYQVIGFLLLFLMSFQILRINQKFLIIESRSYLLALLLLIQQSALTTLNHLHGSLAASVFVLLAIDKLFSSYKNERPNNQFFEIGLLLSIGSLFFFETLFLLIPFWIGIMLLDNFSFRHWALTVIGLLLPYFFATSYFYVVDDFAWFEQIFLKQLDLERKFPVLLLPEYVFVAFVFLITGLASFRVVSQLRTSKISSRKYMRALFYVFLATLILMAVFPTKSAELLAIIAIPISYVLNYFFLSIRKQWVGNMLIFIALIILLAIQLYPLYEPLLVGSLF